MFQYITLLFSEAYVEEGLVNRDGLASMSGGAVLDFRNLEGKYCYCDCETARKIATDLKRVLDNGLCRDSINNGLHASDGGFATAVCLIDSGDYHYCSKLRLDCIGERFSLLLIDHHPDMQRAAFGDILSCGGWVRTALDENPMLDRVAIVGMNPELLGETEGYPGRMSVAVDGDEMYYVIDTLDKSLPLFISIDKDVLNTDYARTNWDQGSMAMAELEGLLSYAASKYRLCGVDICGAYPFSEGGTQADAEINSVSDKALMRLLEKL